MALHRRIPVISMRGLGGSTDAADDGADDASEPDVVSSLASHLQQLSTAASASNAVPAVPAAAGATGAAPSAAAQADSSKLYCICRQCDDGVRPMIDCSACDEWFHLECIGQYCRIVTTAVAHSCVRRVLQGWRRDSHVCGLSCRFELCLLLFFCILSFFFGVQV